MAQWHPPWIARFETRRHADRPCSAMGSSASRYSAYIARSCIGGIDNGRRRPVPSVWGIERRRPGAHTAPWRGPFLLRVPWPLFPHARVPPLLPLAHDALVPTPRRDALHQPGVVHRRKAPTDVRSAPPVDVALLDAHRHRSQGLRGVAARAKSLGEPAPNSPS